jgi:predicted DNA-binding transcriptional regulator AlpA
MIACTGLRASPIFLNMAVPDSPFRAFHTPICGFRGFYQHQHTASHSERMLTFEILEKLGMSNLLDDPPFMRRDEVARLHPVTDRVRARAESVGLFPKRLALAEKIPGWRRAEVNEWLSDPAGWAQRHGGRVPPDIPRRSHVPRVGHDDGRVVAPRINPFSER